METTTNAPKLCGTTCNNLRKGIEAASKCGIYRLKSPGLARHRSQVCTIILCCWPPGAAPPAWWCGGPPARTTRCTAARRRSLQMGVRNIFYTINISVSWKLLRIEQQQKFYLTWSLRAPGQKTSQAENNCSLIFLNNLHETSHYANLKIGIV